MGRVPATVNVIAAGERKYALDGLHQADAARRIFGEAVFRRDQVASFFLVFGLATRAGAGGSGARSTELSRPALKV